MKKIVTILFVLYGFCSYAQHSNSRYCGEKPEIYLFVETNEVLDGETLLQQYPQELNSIYESYKLSEMSRGEREPTLFEFFGCGDEEQAAKELEATNLFKMVIINHLVPLPNSIPTSVIQISNPVKDNFKLLLPPPNNEIKIFDLQGKLWLQQNVGFSAEINVSMLPAGMYVLVVNEESYKFVKE